LHDAHGSLQNQDWRKPQGGQRFFPGDTAYRLPWQLPAYNITVDAKGNATYNGRRAVEMMGNYKKTLDAKTVEALSQSIIDAHFWDFEEEYGGEVADIPGVVTIVTIDGKTKRVNDIRNAPKELKELEAKLEALIGTEGWNKAE
jgi:hypothetical protein